MSVELIKAIGERFITRKDVKAFQRADGAYMPVVDAQGTHLPMRLQDFENHLGGTVTMGHYLAGTDDTCKLFAFDIDLTKTGGWSPIPEDGSLWYKDDDAVTPEPLAPREAWLSGDHPAIPSLTLGFRCMGEALARTTHRLTDMPVAVAYSGAKGLHVYCFTGSIPVADAHDAAVTVLESFGGAFERSRGQVFWKSTCPGFQNYELEIFPKQRSMEGKALGNLMRLPLGVNRKSGQPGYFMWMDGPMTTFTMMDPLAALSGGVPWRK